jgi:hypothetical protein
MTPHQQNTLVTLAIVLGAFVLCGFLAALMGSHSGEVAGALGNVVGGTMGALGAALAVYLTLRGQREDEAEKISTAIIMEVAQLAKFPKEQLVTCRAIHKRMFSPPRDQLDALMQTPQPILYLAAAERISRVPRPALVVAFYNGLAEVQATVNVIMRRASESANLEPRDVEGLGVLLLSQCMLARQILAHPKPPQNQDVELIKQMLLAIINALDKEIETSKKIFPTVRDFEQKTSM